MWTSDGLLARPRSRTYISSLAATATLLYATYFNGPNQVCKLLIAKADAGHRRAEDVLAHSAYFIASSTSAAQDSITANDIGNAALIARWGRILLSATLQACRACGDGSDAAFARRCAILIEAEVLPQSARWHRRDLSPLLLSAWRAVLRGLPAAVSVAGAAADGTCSTCQPLTCADMPYF